MTQIGTSSEHVTFFVADKPATSVITGFQFCDRLFEATKHRLQTVKMDDGSTVPILRQPSKPNTNIPLSDEQCFTRGEIDYQPRAGVIRPSN